MQDRFDEITYHLLGLRSIGSTGPGCSLVKSKLETVIVAVVVFVHSMLRLLSSYDERTGMVEAMSRIDPEGTDRPQRRFRYQGG